MDGDWTFLSPPKDEGTWSVDDDRMTFDYPSASVMQPFKKVPALITTADEDEGRALDSAFNGNPERGRAASTSSSVSIDAPQWFLLDKTVKGYNCYKRGDDDTRTDGRVLERGSILRDTDPVLDSDWILQFLKSICTRRDMVPMRDIRDHLAYAIVHTADTMKLSREQAWILMPLSKEERISLYKDLERFSHICCLETGMEVVVKGEDDSMNRGYIHSIDDDPEFGYRYTVRTPSSSSWLRGGSTGSFDSLRGSPDWDYHRGTTAARIYPPSEGGGGGMYAAARSRTAGGPSRGVIVEERRIPIKILASSTSNSTTTTTKQPTSIPVRIEQRERPRAEPPQTKPRTKFDFDLATDNFAVNVAASRDPSVHQGRVVRSPYENNNHVYDDGIRVTREPPSYPRGSHPAAASDSRANHSVDSHANKPLPERPSSTSNRKVSQLTRAANSDECRGWRVDDRCIWNNEGQTHSGKICFIGFLKGHASIYAGLHFDECVGQGTGLYQGEELFSTPNGHAGFVMLDTIRHCAPSSDIRTSARPSRSTLDRVTYPVEEGPRFIDDDEPPLIDIPGSRPTASSTHPSPPVYGSSQYGSHAPRQPSTSGGLTRTALPAWPNAAKEPPGRPAPPAYYAQNNSRKDKESPPPPVPPRPAMRPEDYMIDSFGVGSCVNVCHLGAQRAGVIKWVGDAYSANMDRLEKSAVVELETTDPLPDGWRLSSQADIPVDHTPHTVLVPLFDVRRDHRFQKDPSPLPRSADAFAFGRGHDFGSVDSGVETSKCEPWKNTDELIGRMKGVQGHRNSCYLDSMLYALFVQTTAFDDILTRRRSDGDIKEYDELRALLATEIVYPLRKFHYVRADHVMKLRVLLAKLLPGIQGLTSEEKDPEEVLSALLKDLFKAKPQLKLICSKDGKVEPTYLYHAVVEAGEWQGGVTSSQHLLERSMRKDSLKFAECPQVLILQLPRYGATKLFDKIVPLERIDITPFVNNAVFACAGCLKNAAELFCHECYLTRDALFGEVSYCVSCFRQEHIRMNCPDHADRPIPPPSRPTKKPARHTMTLSSVLAIETSHYVSFVRSVQGRWMFFDSMADREGLSNGFNIPQVRECDRTPTWLSLPGYYRLKEGKGAPDDPLTNRLLSDSYLCIYTLDEREKHHIAEKTSALLSKFISK